MSSERRNAVAPVPSGAGFDWPPAWLRPKPAAPKATEPPKQEPEYLPTSFDSEVFRLAEPIEGQVAVVLAINGRAYKAVTLAEYIEGTT